VKYKIHIVEQHVLNQPITFANSTVTQVNNQKIWQAARTGKSRKSWPPSKRQKDRQT